MKDAYYFSHDSNARNDVKMIALRRQHGWAGYGLFWALVECMRDEPGYCLHGDRIADLAYEWRADNLQDIVDTCCNLGVFVCEDGCVTAPSLVRRMEGWEQKRAQAREAGRVGGLARAAQGRLSVRLATAQAKKVKESIGEEIQEAGDATSPTPPTSQKPSKKEAVQKQEVADDVTLSEQEIGKLIQRFGEPAYNRMVAKLSAAKGANGKTYKSDYKAILNWVVDACGVKELQQAVRKTCPRCGVEIPGHSGTYCPACGWEKGQAA